MSRADRLAALLEERSLDCLLVDDLVNVRYLTRFTGTNGACIVSRDERLFFTIGTKLEHNSYSGFECQPNVRLL